MYKKLIPFLYFPTTTVVVDDESLFLNSLCFHLENKRLIKSYQDPVAALQFLNHHYRPAIFSKDWIIRPDAEPDFQDYVREHDIDIWRVQETIKDQERFNHIAVVVADFTMPNMDGITFFQSLNEKNFKRILLTAEASEKIAIQAFNAGLIHRYIRKDDPNYLTLLQSAIHELEAEYFQEFSEIPLANLKNNYRFRTCCLDNPCFIKLFNNFLTSHQYVEFYLAGPTGSFIFLDQTKKYSWLVVKDTEQMQFYTEIAADTHSEFVKHALKTRQYVPFFYDHRDELPAVWDKYLYPATMVQGEVTNYYVAHVRDL